MDRRRHPSFYATGWLLWIQRESYLNDLEWLNLSWRSNTVTRSVETLLLAHPRFRKIPIFLRLDRIVSFACVSRALSLFYYGMRLGEFLIRRTCSNTFLSRDLQVTNQNANALRRGPLLLKDDRYVQYSSTSGIWSDRNGWHRRRQKYRRR